MALRYQVSAVIGKYEDRDGKEKSRYVNIGSVMDTKNGGLLLKLDAIPLNWDGFAYLNEPREREERPAQQSRGGGDDRQRPAARPSRDDGPSRSEPFPEDDIPFIRL
jgi:hypothetical protein